MNNTPLGLYQQFVDKGEISSDKFQLQAIQMLDELYFRLTAAPVKKKWHSIFSKSAKTEMHGVYMWGGVGTGKTLLMDIFYQSLPDKMAKRIHFHRFMQRIHDEKNLIKQQQNPLEIVASRYIEDAKVLCLDEFSVTDITDAMILHGLLKYLFECGIVLVTTSNIEIENLYKDGLQRSRFLPAIALLQRHTNAIFVDSGNDYRMEFLQNDEIFHTPLNNQSNSAMLACFEQLSANVEIKNSVVEINGRDVQVEAMGSGVIWLEFDSLCNTNRSKSDYIEISRQFHTVLISNIPQLHSSHDDAARRLIEFIDEIYDRNVNLIVSSAQPAESIYQGKRLAETFKRTISRLNEMSSNEYLAKPHLA